MTISPEQCIQRYLRTGEHEGALHAWAGENAFASAPLGHAALLNALIAAVRTRAPHASVPKVLIDLDVVAFTRAKVAPMVQGLFPALEHAAVLEVLGRAVVFLTPANIGAVLGSMRWLSTAWELANIYLASGDAPLLSDSAPRLVGLSDETTCYACANYFREENRFDDIGEYLDILGEAIAVRSGWKRVLQRCTPSGPGRAPFNRPASKNASDA